MRLHPDYITHLSGNEQIIVATGESTSRFCGIAKGNETTALIVDKLKEETTKEEIIEFLLSKFDVEKSIVEEDVTQILEKLKSIGALIDA